MWDLSCDDEVKSLFFQVFSMDSPFPKNKPDGNDLRSLLSWIRRRRMLFGEARLCIEDKECNAGKCMVKN